MRRGIGVDFGTTNSAVAIATGPDVRVARFTLDGAPTEVFRSMLFFENDLDFVAGRPPCVVGPKAIEDYIESGADGRLMQSMKSFLASRSLTATQVHGRAFLLEELVALVIRGLCRDTFGEAGPPRGGPVVAGRPVHFAYGDGAEDDAFAEERLRKAFGVAGIDDVVFVREPVAAALHYEARLDHDEVVFVADFGGGTSDFSILKVGPGFRGTEASERIVGTGGVGVAGDDFSGRLVDHVVAPSLGKGTRYRTAAGGLAHLPAWIFGRLRRWHELSVLKSKRNTKMLEQYLRTAVEPDRVRALQAVVDEDLGYALYRAVERTKIALSQQDVAEFAFEAPGVTLCEPVSRADFEGWIAPDLEKMGHTVDALLAETGLGPADVDSVFLTGGSARVPAVRRLFEERFGADRLSSGDYHSSIAVGLALHAAALQPSQ